MRDDKASEHSLHHGRSARASSAAGVRPSAGADPASRPPRRGRRRVRERLLQLSALRAGAVLDAERAAALANWRVRQRGRASRLDTHLSPLSSPRRLPDLSCRQDALRRPRSAPRLRGARHDRRLSRRLPVDAGLASRRRDLARVVPRHEQGARCRSASAQRQRRIRRRGRVRGGALAARARGRRRRSAVRAHGLVHLASRSLSRAAAMVGAVPRRRDRYASGCGHPVGGARPAQPAALVPHRAPPRRGPRVGCPAHAPRLLRADELYRREGRQAAGDSPRDRCGGRHA